jgi:hypothetical protein
MANLLSNPTLYYIQGDGVSTTASINVGSVADSVILVAQYSFYVQGTVPALTPVTNVTDVSLTNQPNCNSVLDITFAAPYTYMLHLLVSYSPLSTAAITPISAVALPLPSNAAQEMGGNLATLAPAAAINSTGQVSVTSAATLIITANASRKGVLIINTGNATVYVGTSGVTATTGHALPAGASLSLPTLAAVYGIAATSQTVTFLELQ